MARLRMTSGEWFTLPLRGCPADDRPEVQIRACPGGKQKELVFQHMGQHQKVRNRRVREEDGDTYVVAEHNIDNAKSADYARAVGLFVMVDVRKLELEPFDEESGRVLAASGAPKVEDSDAYNLAGHLTDDLKSLLFDSVQMVFDPEVEQKSLLDWVIARSNECGLKAAEAEAAAGKT